MIAAILLRAIIVFLLFAGFFGLIIGQYPLPGGIHIKGFRIRTLGLFLLLPALCNAVMWSSMNSTGSLPQRDWANVDIAIWVCTGFVLLIGLGTVWQRYQYEKRGYGSPDLVSIQEASQISGISEQELGRLVTTGTIPSVYYNLKYKIDKKSLSAYMGSPAEPQAVYMTVREAAEHFLLSEKEIGKLIATGKLSATQVAGQYRVNANEVQSYLNARQPASPDNS